MHNAPAVYVPTQPEGNGLTLPTLLSLLAHGLVIGLLVYNYQHTEVDMTGSLETVMVSPEQLADMQGQILANRAAAQAQAANANSSATAFTQADASDSNDANQNSSQSSSQQVPSFSRPDDTTGRPLLMSEEHHQRLLEQNREYEQRMAELAEELDESIAESHNPIQEKKQKELEKSKAELEELRYKRQHPDIIMRPTKADDNLKSKPSGSDNAPQNYNLADDGKPTLSASMSSQSGPSGGSSKSKKQYINGIVSQIKNSFAFPENTYGQTVKLIIKVNKSGSVTSVTVAPESGGSDVAQAAAITATRQASPLDIDADNFEDYKEIRVTVTIPSAS
ncbi:cell envelope integrity protein TolA [Psychrobacter sp. SZ93C1]|nr:cell envelope integrity protein TolA [Psychrobacter sp. SZ93C1]